jgi:hypothetical protein
MRENLIPVDRHAAARRSALPVLGRALPWICCLSMLLGSGRARADDDEWRPRMTFLLEGGLAVPVGEYGDDYVGWAVPVRIGVDFRLARHFWIAPVASLGLIRPIIVDEVKSLSGFRILLGVSAELHSAADALDPLDLYGGVDVAFERVVAHGLVAGCSGCAPSDTVTVANGLMAGVRFGALFKVTPDVRIGPYVGAQLSWMPGLTPYLTTHPLNGPSVTTPVDIGHVHFWPEGGIRAAITLD